MKEKPPLTFEQKKEKREWLFRELPESKLFWTTISEEDRAKIESVRELLAENPAQNIILFFNHTSYIDPLYAGYVAHMIDPEMTKELIAPMSYFHTEDDTWIRKIKNLPILAIKNKAEDCGVITSRIIQSYQIDNPKYHYTKEQAYEVNRKFPNLVKQIIKEGKSVMVMISPEGHRSKGALIKAETGIAMIGQITNALYIPIGIDYRGINTRSGIHIGETVIKIGKITKHNPDKNFNDQTQGIMIDLANILPPKRRGVYADLPRIRK